MKAPSTSALCAHRYVQLNKRIYIFWKCLIEGLHAKRAYIGFLADFHILQDQAIFWQTDLFDMKSIGQ